MEVIICTEVQAGRSDSSADESGPNTPKRQSRFWSYFWYRASKLHAHLKCDHSRRAVAAQTDAKQSRRRRSRVRDGAKTGLRGGIPGNAGDDRARKSEIRMVEYVEKLRVEPQLHAFRHRKPLREVEVAPEELRAAQGVAAQISKLAGLRAASPIAGPCRHDLPVGELLLARIDGRDKCIGIEPLNGSRLSNEGNRIVVVERHARNNARKLRPASIHNAFAIR